MSRAQGAGRPRLAVWLAVWLLAAALCALTLAREDGLGLGRRPWQNLTATVAELAHPSALALWFGNRRLEYRSEDGRLLRVEDRRAVERAFLAALGRAIWTTVRIAILGTFLAAMLALPLGIAAARNLGAPRWIAWPAKLLLDGCRAIHTLVFGLLFAGIVGLGPSAGILAIACHSLGSFGKLYAESIEALDMAAVDAVRATGARPLQVFALGVWPGVAPQLVSSQLYLLEFNIRDSTVLGLVGAGGLGLLLTEALSLFQWPRLATLLIAIVILVTAFDALSRRLRRRLL